jgi:hypothetical protein
MSKFLERLVEHALLGIAMVAGLFLFRSVASGTVGGDDCQNDLCVAIRYYYRCTAQTGVVLAAYDCTTCANVGRCQNGSRVQCTPTSNMQSLAVTNVTTICDCQNAPPGDADVQASGSYSGTYTPTGAFQQLCPP